MAQASILVIEDQPEEASRLQALFQEAGYHAEVAYDGKEGLSRMEDSPFDAVVAELALPDQSALDLMEQVLARWPETVFVVVSREAEVRRAVEAVKRGAHDFLARPFADEELLATVEEGLGKRSGGPGALRGEHGYGGIIGRSRAMRRVFELIEKVADADSTVLVLGESGTGKELVARAIHQASPRREGPFVPVNCGAIPEELLESELFGHEKGAFTGAIKTRIGRFELANGGTIFLDEIAEMSPKLQVKLLRVLQERAVERIGSARPIPVDIRVIAATNRDLEREVREGRFREDLYYRLNVIPIHLPPLRERREDIPLLVEHFLRRFARRRKREIKGLSPEAMDCLLRHDWPGNVRELENVIERMVILSSGDLLTEEDVPEYIMERLGRARGDFPLDRVADFELPEEGINLPELLAEIERRLIIKALEKTGWVKNRAAKLLHINRTTLIEKMKKQGITTPAR